MRILLPLLFLWRSQEARAGLGKSPFVSRARVSDKRNSITLYRSQAFVSAACLPRGGQINYYDDDYQYSEGRERRKTYNPDAEEENLYGDWNQGGDDRYYDDRYPSVS